MTDRKPYELPRGWYVFDRNRDDDEKLLAGPYYTEAEADDEQRQWAGVTDPYVCCVR